MFNRLLDSIPGTQAVLSGPEELPFNARWMFGR